jgi:hypothetical protein
MSTQKVTMMQTSIRWLKGGIYCQHPIYVSFMMVGGEGGQISTMEN